MNTKANRLIFFVSVLLVLATAACSLGGLLGSGTDVSVPERVVPISSEAADQARQSVREGTQGGVIRLTESEFTSLLQEEIARADTQDTAVTDVTVWFDPGRITMQATVSGSEMPVEGEVLMAGTMQVDDGRLGVDIDAASINGVPAPDALLKVINQQLDQAVDAVEFSGKTLSMVAIGEGEIVLEVADKQ